jgi:hypothetical protein
MKVGNIPNPYASQDLFVPKDFSDTYVKQLVGRSDARKPFARQVDLWWLALGLGLRLGYRTPLGSRDSLVKFNDGGILSSDPWRITHIELLALAELGEDGLEDPGQTIQMASEFAATGLKEIAELCAGAPEPTLTVVTRIVDYVKNEGN